MKIKIKVEHWLLILIFLLTIAFRLYFVFQVNGFSSTEAYSTLRFTENILETGKFTLFDPLSYSGKEVLFQPVYYYLLSFFSLFIPLKIVLKLIPEILISSLVIIVYLISKQITRNNLSSLFAAIFVGFIPLLFIKTLNQASVYSLVLPIIFYMIYCLIKIKQDQRYVKHFVILSLILPFIHPSAFLLALTLVFYCVLLFSESIKMSPLRKEMIIFAVLFILLIEFLIFKDAFLTYGLNFIKANVPPTLQSTYFKNINILLLIYYLGVLPLVFGCFGVYYGIFRTKRKGIFLPSGIIIAVFLLLLLRWIDFSQGLIFLSIALVIISSLAIKRVLTVLKNTRFYKFKLSISALLILLLFIFSILPSFLVAQETIGAAIPDKTIRDLEWLEKYSEPNSVVLADYEEGNLITGIANRKNVMDTHFLLAPNTEKRNEDIGVIFSTWGRARALELIKKYKIEYIYLSSNTQDKYGITDLKYADDEGCFRLLLENEEAKIYQVIC